MKIDYNTETDLTKLRERITQLESYLDKTEDGELLVECEQLFCPHCGNEVKQQVAVAYCWNCPNPDNFNEIPLPLSYESCLANPQNLKKA